MLPYRQQRTGIPPPSSSLSLQCTVRQKQVDEDDEAARLPNLWMENAFRQGHFLIAVLAWKAHNALMVFAILL